MCIRDRGGYIGGIAIHRRCCSHNIIIQIHLKTDETAQIIDRTGTHSNDQITVSVNLCKEIGNGILIRYQFLVLEYDRLVCILRFFKHCAYLFTCDFLRIDITDNTELFIVVFFKNFRQTLNCVLLNDNILNACLLYTSRCV